MSATKTSRRRAPDWVAVRRLYEEGGTTIAAIAASHGVTPSAVQRRRAAEDWTKRSGGQRTRKAISGKPGGGTGRRTLIARLLKVVDRNLKLMEMHMDSGQPGTAADRERETRAIGTLTRTIEKLTELQSESARATAPKNSSGATLDDNEADRLRLEIAERILRIGAHFASR